MDWTTYFFFALFLVLLGTVFWTVYRKNNPKQVASVKPRVRQTIAHRNIGRPEGAWEQGYSDMVWAIYQIMFKTPRDTEFRFRMSIWDDPVQEMCELMMKANILGRYRKFDIKDGRTSRQYLASPDSQEFAQYVLGGRTAIDHFDDKLLKIREEQELADARQKGLETFDDQYSSARKALGIIRDKDYRVLSEHEEFDQKMRGIEDGKKNKA